MSHSPEAPTPPEASTGVDALAAMGFTTSQEVAESAYARCLILGPGKVGKTTAISTTFPGRLVILNADGDSATKYAKKCGAAFHQLDVYSRATFRKGVTLAIKAARDGLCDGILLDSYSLLGDKILTDLTVTISESRERYGELATVMQGELQRLLDAPAHVFVNCHMTPATEDEGILPLIAGSTKHKAPAMVNDVVLFDYQLGRAPHERMFVCGPQKLWSYGGRSLKRSCAVEATVPALFGELGVAL